MDPLAASGSFWVPNCFSAGMLFQKDEKFFLSTGKTPGMLYAVHLVELPWNFSGKLPAQQQDEKCMPANGAAASIDAVLGAGQMTKALTLDVGRLETGIGWQPFDLFVKCSRNNQRPSKVQLFDYTVHLATKPVEDKCGCGFLIRRGVKSFSLVAYLVHTSEILQMHSATISDLLFEADIRLPKNTSKALKIRRVLEMDSVKNHVSQSTIDNIKLILDQQEEKRKKSKDQKPETEHNDEEDIVWEELETDPAAVACRELLGRLDDDEAEEAEMENPAVQASPAPDGAPAAASSASRESRALLSETTTIPAELLARFPLPSGCTMYRIIHRDSTLPHFQGKLLANASFEGKFSSAASYNPAVQRDLLDESKKTLKSVVASKRSEFQAFYMVWQWLDRAAKSDRSKRRRLF
ncbi:unnamed protein product [Symbiodinium sp. CCMP2456]|nr:unnamed protein product [Symbiodinium sp. CCMP2456]